MRVELAIREHGRGCGVAVELVRPLRVFGGEEFDVVQDFAADAIEAKRTEHDAIEHDDGLVAGVCFEAFFGHVRARGLLDGSGEPDVIACDDGRGVSAARQRCFPGDVARFAKRERQFRDGGTALSGRSAPGRPVGSGGEGGKEREGEKRAVHGEGE